MQIRRADLTAQFNLPSGVSASAGLVAMRGFQAGAMFLIGVLLARGLGAHDFGVFSYVYAWILIAIAVVQFGMPNLLVRDIAAALERGASGQVAGLRRFGDRAVLGLALVTSMFLLAVSFARLVPGLDQLVLMAGLPAVFLMAAMAVNEAMSRGFHKVVAGQLGQLVVRPGLQLLLLALLLLLPLPFTPVTAMATASLSAVAAWGISVVVRRRAFRRLPPVAPEPQWHAVRGSLAKLGAVGLLSIVGTQAVILIMGWLTSAEQIALFAVAQQVTILISLGLIVINSQQAPAYAAAWERGDREEVQRLATLGCRMALALALPIALPALFWGGALLAAFYGEEFRSAALALSILAIGQLVNAGAGSVAVILVSLRHEGVVLKWQAIALLVQIVLAFILVPTLGAVGGAIAATLGLAVWNLALLICLARKYGVRSLPLSPS